MKNQRKTPATGEKKKRTQNLEKTQNRRQKQEGKKTER
jgi:hypothetical protein